jgi:hypothetical protein
MAKPGKSKKSDQSTAERVLIECLQKKTAAYYFGKEFVPEYDI